MPIRGNWGKHGTMTIRRFLPLFYSLCVVSFLFAILILDDRDDLFLDQALLTMISVALGVAVLVMLVATYYWSIRAIGVFLTLTGTAIIYGGSVYFSFQSSPSLTGAATVADLGRSFLMVGGAMIIAGQVMWLRDRYYRDGRPTESQRRESVEQEGPV